jgi:two-component system response regulator DesR
MTKVLIVEDQVMVLGALSALLSMEQGIEVVAQAKDGQEALDVLDQQSIDLVLTDIEMPRVSGLELGEQLQNSHPEVKVIVMTTFSKSGYIKRAMQMGVKGFILKERPSDDLIDTIFKVQQGMRVIDPELALLAMSDDDPLTEKERKAIKLAGEGFKTAQIAQKLFLSEGTVRNYLSEAIAKLNAANRIDAARIAKQKGWI